MKLTVPALLQQRFAVPEKRSWLAQIVGIDYNSRVMTLNIKSQSGPRFAYIDGSLNIGTQKNPNVFPGNVAHIRKVDDEYWVAGWKVEPGKSIGTYNGVFPNSAPSNFLALQVGTNLQFAWNNPPEFNQSEIWTNTLAGPTGATKYAGPIGSTSYTTVLNPGSNSNLITLDPGFESGSLISDGWTSAGLGWTISTSSPHGGIYSAYFTNTTTGSSVSTKYYAATAAYVYTASFWHHITAVNSGNVRLQIQWFDINQLPLSTSTVIYLSAIDAAWSQSTGTVTSPASTAFFEAIISASVSGGACTVYVDDINVLGIAPVSSTTQFYAVRGVNFQTGQASSFSPWLLPVVQSAALGNPSSPHLQEDYLNARYRSSNFVQQAIGSHVGTDGVDGFLIPPGERIAKFTLLR